MLKKEKREEKKIRISEYTSNPRMGKQRQEDLCCPLASQSSRIGKLWVLVGDPSQN